MQNTLLNLASMIKEYDSPFAMEECDGRVAIYNGRLKWKWKHECNGKEVPMI